MRTGRVLAVLALLAATLFFAFGRPTSEPAPTPSAPGADENVTGDPTELASDTTVRVYIDAWSLAALGDTVLVAADGSLLEFHPVTSEHLDQLLAYEPDLIGRTLARLVTADTELFCDATDGCRVRELAVNHQMLADLPSVPAFGPVYDQLGLSVGLWFAELDVAEGFFTVSGGSFGDLDLLHQLFDDAEEGSEQVEDLTDRVPRNGWGKGVFLIAAGAGQLFTPTPEWVAGDGAFYDRLTLTPSAPEALPGEILIGTSVGGPDGLVGLSSGMLTYLTSPTLGCGGLLVCTPRPLEVTVSNYQRTEIAVTQPEVDGEGLLVLVSYDLSFTIDHVAHTAGVWGGVVPPFVESETMRTPIFAGHPPLHTGADTIRVSLAVVFTDAEAPYVANLAYRMAQHGHGDEGHRYLPSNLPELFRGLYLPR